jgi:hypothetical protein
MDVLRELRQYGVLGSSFLGTSKKLLARGRISTPSFRGSKPDCYPVNIRTSAHPQK